MREENTIKRILFVIKQICYKENKKRVDGTYGGVIWNVLSPFIYMMVLSIYYQNVIVHDIELYPVFVFIGIVIIGYYRTGTIGAMDCLVRNRYLLIKTSLPIEVFVDAKVLIAFKEFLYSTVALIPIIIFFKVPITLKVLQVIPILVLTSFIIVGIGKILAVVYLFFGDIDHLYRLLMTMLFYISGVFIPLENMPKQFQVIFSYNPIFLSIYLVRNCVMYNLSSHWTAWLKLIIWALISYGFGSYIFEKSRNTCISRL